MAIFSMILSLLCGVSLFLFGMSLMGDGLKLAAGNKLEAFLYKMTNTPLKGVALGTGVTSVIQSSSATTVMVIGFVNSGMMKLKQAIGIIMVLQVFFPQQQFQLLWQLLALFSACSVSEPYIRM